MSDPRTLLVLPKNSREEIRLSITEFKGATYVDLRTWYEPREGGERKPSREGVSLRPQALPQLLEALKTACNELAPVP